MHNVETPRLIAELANGKLYEGNIAECNDCKHKGEIEKDFDTAFHDQVIICGNRDCGIILGTIRQTAGSNRTNENR